MLELNKTYIGLEIGSGRIAKLIQNQTHQISGLPKSKTASHALIVGAMCGELYVYESHLTKGGVVRTPLNNFQSKNTINFYEYPINMDNANYYVDFNYKYGLWDLFSKLIDLKNDGAGLICSEYVALSMRQFYVCHYFGLPANLITPAHIQRWCIETQKESVCGIGIN